MSLNFEAFWLPAAPRWSASGAGGEAAAAKALGGQFPKREWQRLYSRAQLNVDKDCVRRLWFPNGFVGAPGSLRLGLRDFGFQPVAVATAFRHFKAWERHPTSRETLMGFLRHVLDGEPLPLGSDVFRQELAVNWVTEMLCRPICLAGVGMSDAELGLWWLMVQRARNLAGVAPELRPPASILVRDSDPRLPFWRTKPCGIEPIICSNWEEGWEAVRAWGRRPTGKS